MPEPRDTIPKLMALDGCVGCGILDGATGALLAAAGDATVELARACVEAMRAQRRTLQALGRAERVEDLLVTLGRQYHLIRPVAANDTLLLYVVLHKARANLAMARHQLTAVERGLVA